MAFSLVVKLKCEVAIFNFTNLRTVIVYFQGIQYKTRILPYPIPHQSSVQTFGSFGHIWPGAIKPPTSIG
jgi:hypothetical protein